MALSSLLGGALGGAGVSIVINAVDNFSKTIKSAETQMGGLTGFVQKNAASIGMAGAAITAVGVAGVATLTSWAKEAADTVSIQTAFNNLVGVDAPKMLSNLEDATRGTVSQMDLMKQANQALLLGIDPEALPIMFEGALAAAQATGRPVAEAIADITTGIGRQSKLILDNLGIIVDTEGAYKSYAEQLGKTSAELTEAEKKTAFMNATMEALNKNAANIGPLDDNALAAQRMTKQYEDMKQTIGESLIPVLTFFIEKITAVFEWFNKLPGPVKTAIAVAALLAAGLLILAGVVLVLTAATTAFTAVNIWWIAIVVAVIAIIAALVAACVWLVNNWENVKIAAQNLGIFLKNVFIGIHNIVIKVWNGIVGFIQDSINNIIKMINKVISAMNKILGTNIGTIGEVNLGKYMGTMMEYEKYTPYVSTIAKETGTTINVTGDNYGTDPDAIAEAINKNLKKSINI
jgi:hypothetical protein